MLTFAVSALSALEHGRVASGRSAWRSARRRREMRGRGGRRGGRLDLVEEGLGLGSGSGSG